MYELLGGHLLVAVCTWVGRFALRITGLYGCFSNAESSGPDYSFRDGIALGFFLVCVTVVGFTYLIAWWVGVL